MSKRLFHGGLFAEGLRQTRTLGLVGLTVCLVYTLIQWMGSVLISFLTNESLTQDLVNFSGVATLLLVQVYVFSPLMTLVLFRFLNRRDSSDFYHSLPHRRQTVHFSYFCAIAFWNVVTTLSVSALALVLYGVMVPRVLLINPATVLPFILNMLAAQLLTAAAVLLARSVTGTGFSNVVVTLLILFLPRIVLAALMAVLQNYCMVIDVGDLSYLLSFTCNVVAGLPISIFSLSLDGIGDCLQNAGAGAYTLALALVYFLLAMVLLGRRQSETATLSSPSRRLQAVYRIAFGATMGLLPVSLAFNAIVHREWDVFSALGILVLVVLVATFYFLFELITTRKARNLLRAIPGLFIFLAVDVALLLGVVGIAGGIMAYRPTAESLESVSVVISPSNYFAAGTKDIPLTDPAVREIAAKGLNDTLDLARRGDLFRDQYDEVELSSTQMSYSDAHTVKIVYRENGLARQRYVLVTTEDYEKLAAALQVNETYRQAIRDLPQEEGGMVVNLISRWPLSGFNPSRAELSDLYDTFCREAGEMPFEQWYSIAARAHQFAYPEDAPAQLSVTTPVGSDRYELHLPIDSRFPETYQAYLALYQKAATGAIQTLAEELEAALQADAVVTDSDAGRYDLYTEVTAPYTDRYLYLTTETRQEKERLLSYLKTALPPTGAPDEVVMWVNLDQYTTYRSRQLSVMVHVDEQALADLLEYVPIETYAEDWE